MPGADPLTQDFWLESLEMVLFRVGRGIATAQLELDRNSLATQVLLDNDEYLSQFGLEATWYHFPETTVELRLSLSMHWEEEKRATKPSVWKPTLFAAPLNASYQNQFNFDASAASVVKTRIVSIPPATTIEVE